MNDEINCSRQQLADAVKKFADERGALLSGEEFADEFIEVLSQRIKYSVIVAAREKMQEERERWVEAILSSPISVKVIGLNTESYAGQIIKMADEIIARIHKA